MLSRPACLIGVAFALAVPSVAFAQLDGLITFTGPGAAHLSFCTGTPCTFTPDAFEDLGAFVQQWNFQDESGDFFINIAYRPDNDQVVSIDVVSGAFGWRLTDPPTITSVDVKGNTATFTNTTCPQINPPNNDDLVLNGDLTRPANVRSEGLSWSRVKSLFDGAGFSPRL